MSALEAAASYVGCYRNSLPDWGWYASSWCAEFVWWCYWKGGESPKSPFGSYPPGISNQWLAVCFKWQGTLSSTGNAGDLVVFTQAPYDAFDTNHAAHVGLYAGNGVYYSGNLNNKVVRTTVSESCSTNNWTACYVNLGGSPGPGPEPGPVENTYYAWATVDCPVSGAGVKVAITEKGNWDWTSLSYQDQVSWTIPEGEGGDTSKWLVFHAYNNAGLDEDGFPKVEFGAWSDQYDEPSGYRFWDYCPTSNLSYVAYFIAYPWCYHYDEGSSGPGHVEAGFSPTDTSATFKWRPHYHQSDTIYKVPKPDDDCVFRGWDASSTDMTAYKTVPGSTESDIYSMAYFASKINPTTWQFTDDTYYDKRKWITSCTCTCNGLVTGRVSTNVKIGLYIDDQLVATGEDGVLIWSGLVITATNNVKIKAIEASNESYFLDLNLTSFKLSYYIYEKDDTGLGETRYLCTRYFDGTKWTDWTEQLV